MSLLEEIQKDAVSSNNNITDLLRMCKLLASKLGNKEFDEWVSNELSGYKTKNQLPNYRILKKVEIRGHFSGAFGSGLQNAHIPPSCLDKDIRESLSRVYLLSGISVYEQLLSNNEGNFHEAIPSDFLVYFGDKIYENMNCMSAWKDIPRGAIVGLVDEVRNRILSFVIEIQKLKPDVGEVALNTEPIPQSNISQVFNTQIYGSVGVLSSNNQNSNQTLNIINKGDFSSLERELDRIGINKKDILSLKRAIDEDKRIHKDEMGKKSAKWLSKMLGKATKGVLKISIATTSEILPKLICGYYGIK